MKKYLKGFILLSLSLVCLNFASAKLTNFVLNTTLENANEVSDVVSTDTIKGTPHKVTATMYYATIGQCDSDPLITADGSKIDPAHASEQRMIAVSRDLLEIFNYGDYVEISGTDGQDGIYRVSDTMNKRIKNTIDILETVDSKPYKFENVTIRKICTS